MKWLLITAVLVLSGCDKSDQFRIGQKVTNGVCEGYIVTKYSGYAEVRPFNCPAIRMNFAMVNYDELKVINE